MKKLKALGSKTPTPSSPDISILETFPAPGIDVVVFKTAEFTSKCPVTGQPDFATVIIEYYPDKLCLESKSLKLYLQSYREEKAFMETLAYKIHEDIVKVLNPLFLEVRVVSVARGGVTLDVLKNSYRRGDEIQS